MTTSENPSARSRKHVPRHAPAGKKLAKNGKKRGFFCRFWWVFVAVPLVAMLGVFGTLYWIYLHLQLPDHPPPIQTTLVYARDGKTVIGSFHGAVNRKLIPFGQMPQNLRDAVIATEDHGYYQHPAIDPEGILRAAYTDIIRHEVVQGGSTITQQLVKNVYAGTYVTNPDGTTSYEVPPRTIGQKIREALLAIKLAKAYTKDQILQQYLNTIYFGHGAYGVEAAAETYFGIHAFQLTTLQSAALAGIITSPSFYDPFSNPEGATIRRNYALDSMAKYDFLDPATAAQLKQKPLKLAKDPAKQPFDAPFGSQYFVEYTKQTMLDRYGGASVFGGGLKVQTSLDMRLQRFAWNAVNSHLPEPRDPQAALVAIDPNTGQILAMVGGQNFQRSQVNLATTGMPGFAGSGRQAGSAFKVFTLAAAMVQHYDLNAYWYGPSSYTSRDPECNSATGPWHVSNSSDSEAGTFTLAAATWHSVNTVFAQVVSAVGPQSVVDMAHDLGIRSDLQPRCSITLGSEGVAPLEMTNAYATLADNGVRHWATPLVSVTDHSGKPVPTRKGSTTVASKAVQALDRNDAELVTQTLTGVVKYGTGYAALIPGRDIAGKTGTAQNYVDAWFCGYTPQLATCVWVGYPKNDKTSLVDVEGVPEVFGGTIPAAIWHDFMVKALAGMRVKTFPPPQTMAGYTLGPPTPVPSPTPRPTHSPKPKPSPSPSPSPSPTPSPSPSWAELGGKPVLSAR